MSSGGFSAVIGGVSFFSFRALSDNNDFESYCFGDLGVYFLRLSLEFY